MNKFLIILALAAKFSSLSSAEIPANPTILYIGDSHSYGKLGTTIEKRLSVISNHIILEASCGATANTWLGKSGFEKTVCGYWKKNGIEETRSVNHQVPKFSNELEKYNPQVVIVQLGTNLAVGSNAVNSGPSIIQIMKQIKQTSAQCIWIGPPDANSKVVTRANLKTVNALLIDLAAKNNCHFVDSLKLTQFPKSSAEGIHYPPDLSKAWGEKVSDEILKILKFE